MKKLSVKLPEEKLPVTSYQRRSYQLPVTSKKVVKCAKVSKLTTLRTSLTLEHFTDFFNWLLLLWALFLSPVFAERPVDIPQPADLNLVEEKRLLKAVETAQQAVRNSPDDAEVWGQLGHVYLSHRWEVPAIACYRRANTLAPDEFRWLYFLGRLTTRREPEAAVKHLNRALALNDTYAPVHLYLASALRILGKFDAARQHLESAKRLQPDNPFSELWLGEIAFARRQVKIARTHLENALRLNPGQSEAHALMAQVAIALGDREAAEKHAHAARRPSRYNELSDPLWWDVLKAGVTAPLYAERGRRYMAAGDYASAITEFEVLISRTQKDIDIWLDYGVSLLHTERYREAFAALEHTQMLLRSDADVRKEKKPHQIAYLQVQTYNHIAQIYYEIGQTDAAILTGQEAIQLFRNTIGNSQLSDEVRGSEYTTFLANVHANLAMAYEDIGQPEQAIAQYQKALELVPTKGAFHRDLAGIYWKGRRYAEAEFHYKMVVADWTEKLDSRTEKLDSDILKQKHEVFGPISELRHEVFDPATDVQAVYRLGLIFLTKGDYEAAIAQFEKVIELWTEKLDSRTEKLDSDILKQKHEVFDPASRVGVYEAVGIAYKELGDVSAAIGAFEKVLQLEPGNKNASEMLKELRERK